MILIFCFSSLTSQKVHDLSEPGIDLLNHVVTKIDPKAPEDIEWLDFGHAIGYIFLASGLLFAITSYPRVKKPYLLSLLGSFLYALTDEFHQLFVSGRSCEIKDVLIDSTAASLVLLVILVVNKIKQKKSSTLNQ
jgi:VanZ family protein